MPVVNPECDSLQLIHRGTVHYSKPTEKLRPHPKELSFTDFLTEVRDCPKSCQFIFTFKYGGSSNTGVKQLTCHKIPGNIKRILLWHNHTQEKSNLSGIQLFDTKDKMVYESAHKAIFKSPDYKSTETTMLPGERIIGVKSMTKKEGCAYHQCF